MKMKGFHLAISAVIITGFYFVCGRNPITGTGTQTGNPVTSMVYNPGGSPAANAKVSFYYYNNDPRPGQSTGPADSTITDSSGNYSITLDTGTYNVFAQGDSGLAFQDSIGASGGSSLHPPACTLKTPGTIGGIVELEQNGDPRTVYILFLGTYSYTTPDDASGGFISEPIAAGKYRVRILTTLPDYDVMDTSFIIRPGVDSLIPETLILKYKGIPTPENFVVSYDTLNETVILSWDMPDTSLISGYNVYRSIKGQNFSLVTQTPLPDTQTAFQDNNGIVIGNVYEYRVVSRTSAGIESRMIDFDADTALIVSRSLVSTSFSWYAPDTTSIYDTVSVSLCFSNPTRKIITLEWYIDSVHIPILSKNISSLSCCDTIVYYCPAQAGLIHIIVKATDEASTIWQDTFELQGIQDIPVVNAGEDMCFAPNDTAYLHGSATQRFGKIIEYQWKINQGNWTTTGGPDTMVIISDSIQTYICSLAVTDDDGNRAVDEIKLFASKVEKIAAGVSNSLILKYDNTLLVCEGAPVQLMSEVQNMDIGCEHNLILKVDNTLWAYGNNHYGQLGTGDTIYRSAPVQVMSDVQSLSAGDFHSLVLKTDGTLWVFGRNREGQLGTGDTLNRKNPVQIMNNVQSISGGGKYSFIVKNDNTLWVCGDNDYGKLGIGRFDTCITMPEQVMNDVQSVSAGENHSLVLKNDGTLLVSGYNKYGQLGTGDSASRSTFVPIMSAVKSATAGGFHSLIVKNDGTLWACGRNIYGQLGDGDTTDHLIPIHVMDNVLSVAAGRHHSMIIKNSNTLWACGQNSFGQLGDGTTADRHIPVRIIPPQ